MHQGKKEYMLKVHMANSSVLFQIFVLMSVSQVFFVAFRIFHLKKYNIIMNIALKVQSKIFECYSLEGMKYVICCVSIKYYLSFCHT